ncbi:hypothetical protein GALMADRAFT_233556 [Galerina marginata CBS 339.88]|uniref:Anaphase-promoting complex subunit 4 n=1 Tax=Galerina marginata (strain CBS 339.88) TaxID=685588 RepID=A0A067TPC8_GALM3|nr:hypothetical protein GALMADRAFT_233556 [Galerina marginata CBS 339.88]
MGLWSSSRGSRIWETDVSDGNENSHVISIAWSPDGRSIAVVRDPPAISLHSLQDGHITLSLPISLSTTFGGSSIHISGVWWFRDEKKHTPNASIPDIFKRNEMITGSAHSILRLLPLLDSLQEETDKLTATDLFAFQGSHTRTSHKSQLPSVIETWPTLSTDLVTASISNSSHNKQSADNENLDEMDTANIDSILLVVDKLGHLFCYLDGTFPLGSIVLGSGIDYVSVAKHPVRPLFTGQRRVTQGGCSRIYLNPAVINIPLLSQRKCRDLARLSSSARELVWYSMRVVKEMHEAWYGSESSSGARELGPKWVKSLESKQKEQFGQEEPNPILDLTSLLTTGRPSESLLDFLGSGEQMSERGIQKWESTVSEALIKLRDSSEKRIAPALQRLHIVLDEIQGWAKLPQFASFDLKSEDIALCIDIANRGIIVVSWLAAIARRELLRFREFIAWIRYEVSNVNSPNDGNIARHDILEVNNYFVEGLETSPIDNWFIGPVPWFRPVDIGIPDYGHHTLSESLQYARNVAGNASLMGWQKNGPQKDLNNLDRNIEALIQELANRCQQIFHQASGAASRSAIVSFDLISNAKRVPEKERSSEQYLGFPFRERTILNEAGEFVQYLVSHMSSSNNNTILLTQHRFGVEAPEPPSEIGIALLECYLPEEGQERSNFDLLDADFFDDECVVIVYRLRQGEEQSFIATLPYNEIGYQNLQDNEYVKRSTREDLMQDYLELWKNGHLTTTRVPINRRRALSGCKSGGVSLALNGRINRRVACVLDSTGTTLESFDLEGDGEDMEDARAG